MVNKHLGDAQRNPLCRWFSGFASWSISTGGICPSSISIWRSGFSIGRMLTRRYHGCLGHSIHNSTSGCFGLDHGCFGARWDWTSWGFSIPNWAWCVLVAHFGATKITTLRPFTGTMCRGLWRMQGCDYLSPRALWAEVPNCRCRNWSTCMSFVCSSTFSNFVSGSWIASRFAASTW